MVPFSSPWLRQDPLSNPGAAGLCKRPWNMLEPNASSHRGMGAGEPQQELQVGIVSTHFWTFRQEFEQS